METKFTKGPWEPTRNGTAGRIYGVHAAALGRSPVVVWRGIARAASPEGRANAHLIATAPELYSETDSCAVALEEAANVFAGTGMPGMASILREHAARARAALRKARGEPLSQGETA